MSASSYLPTIGLEIPCSAYGVNIPLQVNVLGVITLDIIKGGIKVRVDSKLNSGLGGVQLKIIGFEMSGSSPVLGQVTLSQFDIDQTPISLLEVISENPPILKQTLYIDATMTIEKPPGGGPALQLVTAKPLKLVYDRLQGFPPQGQVFQLQEPVDFAPVQSPGQNVVKLLQYPLTVSHNP